jgi:hypothetical protein
VAVNETAPAPGSAQAPPPAYFPGWIARWIVGLMLGLVFLISTLRRLDDPPFPLHDPAVCNILSLIFSFIAVVTLGVWFCFQSGYAAIVRRGVLLMAIGLRTSFTSAAAWRRGW